MIKPLITTIIPTYRRPKLLQRAIKSVLNQTYPHFQVCVYDNASGDETAEVVSEFAKKDSRVKYHCHPENIGGIKNFNYGMERVDTPFFSFLSDDDILLPVFYQTALEGFEKYPAAMFSVTRVRAMNSKGNILGREITDWKEGFYQPPEGLLAMLRNGHPTWTGILFRRDIIEKVGLLNEEVNIISDLDFIFRTAAHFPFVLSLTQGAIFSVHPESGWVQASSEDILKGYLKIIHNLIRDEHLPPAVRIYIKYLSEKYWERLSSSRRVILNGIK